MNIPTHVAFIMDGNRRWAQKNKLALFFGHKNGVKQIETITEHAGNKGIKVVTCWAFSTENWNRPQDEILELMDVFRDALADPMVKRLYENGVKIQILGDLSSFPEDIQKSVREIREKSKNNTKLTLNIALGYGGRKEIIDAINCLLKSNKQEVSEEEFKSYLYTGNQPDPDLIIRTGGEKRLSGYLPFQSVYSELYFTDTLWPDFNVEEFDKALDDFAQRQRNFGT